MGEAMSAVSRICHKSCPQSKVMQEHSPSKSGVAATELGKYVLQCLGNQDHVEPTRATPGLECKAPFGSKTV